MLHQRVGIHTLNWIQFSLEVAFEFGFRHETAKAVAGCATKSRPNGGSYSWRHCRPNEAARCREASSQRALRSAQRYSPER
jgi:hypothetical protein